MAGTSRPIFVLGTAYSGSSILSWALAQHPNITHVLETPWLAKLASDLESLYELGTAQRNVSHLVAMSLTRSRFYQSFGSTVNELFLSNSSSMAAPQRWIDCTPDRTSDIPGLLRLFPEAKFLHTVHDVESVVGSLVKESSYSEESACEYWLRTTKTLLEAEMALGSERFMRIRYKELLTDPEQTLRSCLSFLDEPYSSSCLRIIAGITDGSEGPPQGACYEMQTNSPIRYEAELLSRLLIEASPLQYLPDTKGMERLDGIFSEKSRGHSVNGAAVNLSSLSPVERVQYTAQNVLPPDAAVMVITKGDDELLKLGERRAGHFPQNEQGIYAGFHPADSSEAIAHLEGLRSKGYNFLLIPDSSLWWLDYYKDFARHLQLNYRLFYYQNGVCVIFRLEGPTQEWYIGPQAS